MKVNMQMSNDYNEIMEVIREKFYPGSKKNDYRSSFLCNQIIDWFDMKEVDVLKRYLERDGEYEKYPRTITFREKSYNKLCDISDYLKVTPATLMRGLILLYSESEVEKLPSTSTKDTVMKIAQIEKKLSELLILVTDLKNDISK